MGEGSITALGAPMDEAITAKGYPSGWTMPAVAWDAARGLEAGAAPSLGYRLELIEKTLDLLAQAIQVFQRRFGHGGE